jgi:hypothetical protein
MLFELFARKINCCILVSRTNAMILRGTQDLLLFQLFRLCETLLCFGSLCVMSH